MFKTVHKIIRKIWRRVFVLKTKVGKEKARRVTSLFIFQVQSNCIKQTGHRPSTEG